MNRLFFVIAIACVTASGSFASPSENVIHSLGHLGITPSPEQREDVIAQYDAAQASTDYPDWFAQSSARLVDLAELSQSATRPSA